MHDFQTQKTMNLIGQSISGAKQKVRKIKQHRSTALIGFVCALCLLGSASIVVAFAPEDGVLLWVRPFQGFSAGIGWDVAQDTDGNTYVTGEFANLSFDFDDVAAGEQNGGVVGQKDVFVAKLNADGTFAWARTMGSENIDESRGIAVDAVGAIYTVGNFRQVAELNPSGVFANTDASDPANLLNPLVTAGDLGFDDIFISKLDTDGGYLWAHRFGGPDQDFGWSIAADSNANVYATGAFSGTVDFDPSDASAEITSSRNDAFLVSLDAEGMYRWAKHIDGPSSDQGRSVATDSQDNVYLTGYIQGANVDFDPGSGNAIVNGLGRDLFLLKYSSAGDFRWVRNVPSVGSDFGNAIAVDSTDTIYIVGSFESVADFNPDPVVATEITSNGSGDIFVAAYGPDGSIKWARAIGGPEFDEGHDVTTDSDNNVYITGQFRGTVDFDPGAGINELTSAGDTDAFILKLNSVGSFVSVTQIGGTGADVGYGLVADANAGIVTTGSFSDAVDFDPDAANARTVISAGQTDIFVSNVELAAEAPPTAAPTDEPTAAPTDEPTTEPTTEPTPTTPEATATPQAPSNSNEIYLPLVNR